MPIHSATIVARNAAIIDSVLDDEVIVVNPESGETIVLEGSGRAIWEQIGEPRKVADICAAIEVRYAVDPARCLVEVCAFLEELAAKGMVSIR